MQRFIRIVESKPMVCALQGWQSVHLHFLRKLHMKKQSICLISAASVLLAACGGGGSSNTPDNPVFTINGPVVTKC
jgi:hypothetical protein